MRYGWSHRRSVSGRPEVRTIFRDLDGDLYRAVQRNPISFLKRCDQAEIEERAHDLEIHARIDRALRHLHEYLAPVTTWGQIFELRPLTEDELFELISRALMDAGRGLGYMKIKIDDEAARHLARLSDGDARKALNSLEIAALTTPPESDGTLRLTLAVAEQSNQKKAIVYDGDGDAHYDTISAFIKAMRGSDPDAALYWLAKMIHAGEDPRFIARRIVIHAAEDVGLADPMALVLANAAFQAAALEPESRPFCR